MQITVNQPWEIKFQENTGELVNNSIYKSIAKLEYLTWKIEKPTVIGQSFSLNPNAGEASSIFMMRKEGRPKNVLIFSTKSVHPPGTAFKKDIYFLSEKALDEFPNGTPFSLDFYQYYETGHIYKIIDCRMTK